MPIKSYLVHAMEGKKDQLVSILNRIPSCQVNPSTNQEVLVLVTDTLTVPAEKKLEETLGSIVEIKSMALVSGFDI